MSSFCFGILFKSPENLSSIAEGFANNKESLIDSMLIQYAN